MTEFCPCVLDCWTPPAERIAEQHCAVRFNDHKIGAWRVFYEDVEITNRCVEALGGEWAIVLREPTRLCEQDLRKPCSSVVFGAVRVECSIPLNRLTVRSGVARVGARS